MIVVAGAALASWSAAALCGGAAETERLWPLDRHRAYGVLQAAGLLFFAFAGYARIATLGEEVVDPARTIPRAIPIALGITLVVYAAVAVSALLAGGRSRARRSPAPLATAVEAGRLAWLAPVVRVGAAIASLGVLLSLIVGVSRTMFAMASNRDLPRVPRGRPPALPRPAPRRARGRMLVAVIAASPTCARRSASARSRCSPTTRSRTRPPGPWRGPSGAGRAGLPSPD